MSFFLYFCFIFLPLEVHFFYSLRPLVPVPSSWAYYADLSIRPYVRPSIHPIVAVMLDSLLQHIPTPNTSHIDTCSGPLGFLFNAMGTPLRLFFDIHCFQWKTFGIIHRHDGHANFIFSEIRYIRVYFCYYNIYIYCSVIFSLISQHSFLYIYFFLFTLFRHVWAFVVIHNIKHRI